VRRLGGARPGVGVQEQAAGGLLRPRPGAGGAGGTGGVVRGSEAGEGVGGGGLSREEPEWVERVRDEWESFRDVQSTAFWAEMPLQATVAILLNLHE